MDDIPVIAIGSQPLSQGCFGPRYTVPVSHRKSLQGPSHVIQEARPALSQAQHILSRTNAVCGHTDHMSPVAAPCASLEASGCPCSL